MVPAPSVLLELEPPDPEHPARVSAAAAKIATAPRTRFFICDSLVGVCNGGSCGAVSSLDILTDLFVNVLDHNSVTARDGDSCLLDCPARTASGAPETTHFWRDSLQFSNWRRGMVIFV